MDLCDLVKVAPVPQKSPTLDLVKSKLFDYAVRGVKRWLGLVMVRAYLYKAVLYSSKVLILEDH